MIAWLLAGCAGTGGTDTGAPPVTGDDDVVVRFDPDPPTTGGLTDVQLQVVGPDGRPVDDLQQVHERMVHTFLISRDLSVFAHLHHEDFGALTADDLRTATFHFPYGFGVGGDWLAYFEFAHENLFHVDQDWFAVDGEPAQAAEPILDGASVVTVGDVTAELVWDSGPSSAAESSFHLHLTTADGDVTDLVQWLAADGHGAIASADLANVTHTHAWVPGMDQMSPSMVMPHAYDGPDLPFRTVLSGAGWYKMWIQFARSGAPDEPYTVPFTFEVN